MLGTHTATTRRTTMNAPQYTCRACHKVFVMETRYLEHKCKQMKREEEMKSPDGQAAWHYYTLWLRAQRRQPPAAQAFMSSKYFRTFNEFVKFARQVSLPAPDKFIWLMVQKDFQPTMWRSDDVYGIYMEYLDRQVSPLDQVSMSIKVLSARSAFSDIDLSEVFTTYTAQELIHFVRTRQLSPWLLLFSKKFRMVMANMTTEQRLILENLIRPDYWAEQFQQNAEHIPTIKMLVNEMGI